MAEAAESTFVHPETVDIWLEYAQKRFDDASHRIEDYRSWGRQIVGWVGVIIGLEVSLLPRIREISAKNPIPLSYIVLSVVVATTIIQMIYLSRAASIGFHTTSLKSPENPSLLVEHLKNVDSIEAKRIIAAYFAKSYDSYHQAAEDISGQVSKITKGFTWTLWLFTSAAVGYTCLVFLF